MANPSNLYAEKIFAEHPLSLWALDDNVDFVSLLNSNDKIMLGWDVSSNINFLSSTTQAPYIENTPIIPVEVENSSEGTITSEVIINGTDLDASKETFNLSTYFRGDVDAIVKIGYLYNSEYVYEEFPYVAQTEERWALLSKTFPIPGPGAISIKIAITQSVNVANTFYFNNFSFGQWSESFVSKSSGNLVEELSSYRNINLPAETYAVPAKAYGLTDNDGYYIASSNRLYSYNEGFPLIYGATNVTKIEKNEDLPSLIVPGFGFLNESGKYYDLTAEMWLKIDATSVEPKRIFGPIASSDGIYINGEFLIIRVGNNYGSYCVGELGRPMLLHFRVSQNTASLLVDGEQAISIEINTEQISMPKPFAENGKEQDWLGFYSYDNISVFEIDAIAIYGYQIPEIVAKRRFVYGQGVEFPELSSASLISSSAFIDYRVAGYSNNFMFPDMARWSQGITDNIVIDAGTIKTPKYKLPSVFFNNPAMTTQEWLTICDERPTKYDSFNSVNFSLSSSAAGSGGYIYFDNLNVLSSKVAGVYGVFRRQSTAISGPQILFKIVNKLNGNSFTASVAQNQRITYTLSDNVESDIIIDSEIDTGPDELFVAGVNFRALNRVYGGRMSKFFGSSKNLSVYVAGQDDAGVTTFYGEVYRFGFMTERNLNSLADYFTEDQTHITVNDQDDVEDIVNFIASYTLTPYKYIDRFEFDIAVDSYWQDYVPLSRIDGSVLTAEGDYVKRLSFLQFNANVPILKQIVSNKYNFDNNQVKMYVTFQYLTTKPNVDHTLFTITEKLSPNKTIIPQGNWLQTKYEIADDSIIYLPQDADYKKLALVIHLEIQAKASLSNEIKIKTIQVASQALSDVEPKRITTRFGDSLFAYILRGIYPDYSAKNPVSIYKGSTPYLYLTNTSGIKLVGTLDDTRERGIRYVLNQQASNLYRVGASQILARYYEDTFPTTAKKLLSYKGFVVQAGKRQERIISIYVVSANTSNTRGRLLAIDERTGLVDPTVYFYLNGSLVKDLYITPRSWNMIGLQFQVALDVNSSIGYVDISGPLLVHGISNYRLTSIQDAQSSLLRSWAQVRTMIDKGGDVTNWGDFLSSEPVTTWQTVLYIPTETSFLVDAATPYKIYTGTNKIIVGDDNKFRINKYQYKVYQDIVWQSSIFDAV